MYIEKDNLIIRSATVKDAEILTNWWNDGEVMAHAGFPNGLGQAIEDTIKQIETNKHKLSQTCIIKYKDIPIGEMSFGIGKNLAEIGIKICQVQYQNQGFGSILIKMLIEYLFTDPDLNNKVKINKIILDTNLNNKRAQHVYEAIGFKKVATNINAWKDQLGEYQCSVDYEMTLEDFLGNNNFCRECEIFYVNSSL